MLELLLCSSLTVLPDYLFRRFAQGKRIGREITLFSVWYELRWGITACVLLTLTLITLVFFFHPATNSAVSFFRTVPIMTERIGRVEEVYFDLRGQGEEVEEDTPLFRLESSEQEAAAETARRRIAEVEAEMEVAQSTLAEAEGRIVQARGAHQQALDEYDTRAELFARNPDAIAAREVERAKVAVDTAQGAVDAALANKNAVASQIGFALPAQRASAEAELAQAEAELAKSTIYAGVHGTLTQFAIRRGDLVNPMLRPAGILVPSGRTIGIVAGFGQIEAQVIRVGMIGEAACASIPWRIIPLVVTEVQDVIAAGQVRPTDLLIDPTQVTAPGTITVTLEPLFPGGLDRLPPGSSCTVNTYTSYHDRLESPDLGALQRIGLHAIDAIGLIHAMLLRLQAILMPVRMLVLGGGH